MPRKGTKQGYRYFPYDYKENIEYYCKICKTIYDQSYDYPFLCTECEKPIMEREQLEEGKDWVI